MDNLKYFNMMKDMAADRGDCKEVTRIKRIIVLNTKFKHKGVTMYE